MTSVSLALLCCLSLVAFTESTGSPFWYSTRPWYRSPTTQAPSQLDVHVVATPSKMHEGFTKYLSVNCTFNHTSGSDFRTIMSLLLSKSAGPNDDNFVEIATVTAFSNVVDISNHLGATVNGYLEHMSVSYISFEWKYPTSAVEGKYRCEAYGMDNLGHPRDTKAITTVTERSVDIEMLLENMKKMDVELDELLTFKQQMSARLMQSMMALMEKTESYNGKTYYLSKPTVKNAAVSESMCQLYGGELLVIDDLGEMTFINSFMENNDTAVALGVTDEKQEGQWLSISTGAPARYLQYLQYYGTDTSKNCLYTDGSSVFDDECAGMEFTRFVCEM